MLAVHADTEFSEHERWVIEGVRQSLVMQTVGLYQLSIVYDLDFERWDFLQTIGQATMARTMSDAAWLQLYEAADNPHHDTLGVTFTWRTDLPPRVYLILDRIGPEDDHLAHVAEHELLHAIGLQHVTDPDAVMAPATCENGHCEYPTCFTLADADEFCRVVGCDPVQLRPCH